MGLFNFWRKFKKNPFKVDDKLTILEAFKLNGKTYYQCATATDLAAGRGLTAMIVYEEFRMKCDKEYLQLFIRAMDKILSGESGKINLNYLRDQVRALDERVNLCGMPDHIFKLASIYFWDESESPYYYDFEYNRQKIDEWKKTPEALSFFLSQPLKELIPFSESQDMSAENYLRIAEMIGKMQERGLHEILSKAE